MQKDVDAIIGAISSVRITSVLPEYDIHKLVEQAFTDSGIDFVHEARLGKGRRADFLVNRTAVEVKKGAPAPSLVLKQIAGYLQSELVDDIVIVTRRKIRLPAQIGGKQVFMITLDRLWGISLP